MGRTVGNKLKQAFRMLERLEDFSRDGDVLQFALAADIVDLTFFSLAQNEVYRLAVVLHMYPVADIPAISIDWQRQPGQRLGDHQGNKFFWKLKRPIVVGAARNEGGKPMGLYGRTNKQVRSSFAGSVWAGWIKRRGFGELSLGA